MKEKKLYLISAIGLLVSSCGGSIHNSFCDNTVTVGADDEYTRLEARLLLSGDTLPHINDIMVVGDKLVTDMDDDDARLQMFSLDGKRVGVYGRTGRAQDEYTGGMSFVAQPDDKHLYLRDVNKAIFSVLHTDSVKENGRLIAERVIDTFPRLLNVFLSGESELIYEHEVPGSYALSSRNIGSDSDNWEEVLYEPSDNPFAKYHSYMVFNDKEKKIAAAMRFANQMNFIDLNNKGRKSAIVRSVDNPARDTEGHQYYCKIAANDSNVYALYMDQSAEDAYESEKPMEIHVFDWDGNFIDKYLTDEYIIRLAVDKNGTLYGKTLDGSIYSFRKSAHSGM